MIAVSVRPAWGPSVFQAWNPGSKLRKEGKREIKKSKLWMYVLETDKHIVPFRDAGIY